MASAVQLTRKDLDPGNDVRWCPGCGDYSVLANVQRTLPKLGVPREQLVFISGIGCSSRFPYYMNTYGFHTIHGRAPAIATGLKSTRPELSVWLVTGDGDGLSIGAGHFVHVLRRNVDLNVLLFNNRIYGLTKGQYSPTSEEGKRTKSTPMGSIDHPFDPLPLALGADASFVARVVDTDAKMMQEVLVAAHQHQGTALIEILQNCPVFNDGAFAQLADKKQRAHHLLPLQHGKPLVFGPNKEKGIMMRDCEMVTVTLGEKGVTEDDLLVHRTDREDVGYAQALARLKDPHFPTPVGVLRAVKRPTYDAELNLQMKEAVAASGRGSVQVLLESGDTWRVA